MIDYRLQEPLSSSRCFPFRLIVVDIFCEKKGEGGDAQKMLKLNNNDVLVDSLHLIRHVFMRDIYTNETMWNLV